MTDAAKLTQARREAELAKKRLIATAGALQYRLKPGVLAGTAIEGMRDKGEELAEDAIQAVKDRPIKVSGVLAGIGLFLARNSIKSAIRSLRGRKHEDYVVADLEDHDKNYDLTAPAVKWSKQEGVKC